MLEIFLRYALDMDEYSWEITDIYMRFVWNKHEIHMPKIRLKYARCINQRNDWAMPEVYPNRAWEMPEKTQDVYEIYLRLTWDLPYIYPRYT